MVRNQIYTLFCNPDTDVSIDTMRLEHSTMGQGDENPSIALDSSWASIPFSQLNINLSAFFLAFPHAGVLRIPSAFNFVSLDGWSSQNLNFPDGVGCFYDKDAVILYFGIESTPSAPVLPSLNGDGCEYIDGDTLTVVGRDYPMTVKRSSRVLVSDNNYTVIYDLESDNGAKVTAPENLVSRYVVSLVTTP